MLHRCFLPAAARTLARSVRPPPGATAAAAAAAAASSRRCVADSAPPQGGAGAPPQGGAGAPPQGGAGAPPQGGAGRGDGGGRRFGRRPAPGGDPKARLQGAQQRESRQTVEEFLTEKQLASERGFRDAPGRREADEKLTAPRAGLLSGKPYSDWQDDPAHSVAYRYRLPDPPVRKKRIPGQEREPPPAVDKDDPARKEAARKERDKQYTNFTGLRFPTLETAENYDYHKDRGLDRVAFERAYPIKVPGYRRLDPYLREYIHFLVSLDPVRFTAERIAERYRLRVKTVAMVVREWSVNRYLTKSGLVQRLNTKQKTREEMILRRKEGMYHKWVGWDQLGDEDDSESDDEAIGPYKGWRSTSDWIRRQSVEVEMMHAFPMSEKRDPMPKRVDVDMVVDNTKDFKVINWIDPSDKVVF